jgi:hypothetical protein
VRAPFRATRFEVESAFEVAPRPIAPEPDAFGGERPAERPTGATPQRGFATIADGRLALTLASRGSAEVEAVPEGDGTSLAVTVLRAVGWLSREDLVARPGHAGPALATPGAQALGSQRCELSLRLHTDGDPARFAEASRHGAPALLFAGGGGPDEALGDGDRLLEVDDPEVAVSAIEPRLDGRTEIRLVNLSARARRVRVRWNGRGAGLERIDLRGEPVPGAAPLPAADRSAALDLRPWEIVALRTTPQTS